MTQSEVPPIDMSWPPPRFLPPPLARVDADGTRHFEGVTYATTFGYRPRLLDAHIPATTEAQGPPPVVVWIHGGGWMDGDRRYPPPTVPAELLFGTTLAAGLGVVTVDYRHSLEAPFPAQLHDVKAAIRYVRHFAESLGVDAERPAVWGESAGGHLAALAGLTPGRLEGDQGVTGEDTSVSAVVDWYGVSDVTAAARAFPAQLAAPGPDAIDPYTALLGGSPAEQPESARAASPVSYTADGDNPPFLLIHGTADGLVPFEQSVALADRLRASGSPVELVPVEGADHIFLGASDIPALVRRSVEFLAGHLGVKTSN
ncbi:alpha/beta hydrolase [Streptacidiphilus jiangxiensis]|uniref:Acetyl esterase/lipase n=1 Tax=Streptacidiphilus jiangxiensis TaxID=235985 RepID=A0A1H7P213_STRJI|nr:alpha/beta hydrolase [Streptacidiphilus jiangxiensis]SEL29841.1 Acetyl esterase/lipase [Streptacidiphilus jiangxiensis]